MPPLYLKWRQEVLLFLLLQYKKELAELSEFTNPANYPEEEGGNLLSSGELVVFLHPSACSSLTYLVFEMRLCAILPLLKHFGEFIQATMVKVKNLILTLPASNHQLPAGAGLITEGKGTERDAGESRPNLLARCFETDRIVCKLPFP